jgi:hypothetical protein
VVGGFFIPPIQLMEESTIVKIRNPAASAIYCSADMAV